MKWEPPRPGGEGPPPTKWRALGPRGEGQIGAEEPPLTRVGHTSDWLRPFGCRIIDVAVVSELERLEIVHICDGRSAVGRVGALVGLWPHAR